ncbi:putative conserved membrane protein, partial [Chlamydia psittaci 06-1683]
QKSNFSV